ncbi:akt-1 [Bugula neritina]|uniref:Akt-1 n=1 Tax=Bugula neritina TaxID=10212 RepID=A0A7J7JEM9_BUGNE|nr:akt-1 [Bugula neritina]
MVEFFYCLIILNKTELQLVAGNLWAPIYEVKLVSTILRDRTSSAVCLCQQKRGVCWKTTKYGRAVDWWGTGVVMYEMMCGRLPFYNKEHETLFELIVTQNVRFLPVISGRHVSAEWAVGEESIKKTRGGVNDVNDIKAHIFFANINWDDLYHKRVSYLPYQHGW